MEHRTLVGRQRRDATHLVVWLSDGVLDPRAPFVALGATLREGFGMALASLAWQQPAWQARLTWFVPLGRMALSVYLSQTVVQLLLFSRRRTVGAGALSGESGEPAGEAEERAPTVAKLVEVRAGAQARAAVLEQPQCHGAMDADLDSTLVERTGQDGRTPVLRDRGQTAVLRVPEELTGTLSDVARAEDVERQLGWTENSFRPVGVTRATARRRRRGRAAPPPSRTR